MMESVPPDPRSPGAAVGVTEPMIHALVHGFYDAIRTDPMLGPIFDREIGDGWDAHLETMCNFWSSVVLMSGRFKGAPMVVHARISDINGVHFTRWLQLFRQAARALTPPDAAALFISRSEAIAQRLQIGIAAHRDMSDDQASVCSLAKGLARPLPPVPSLSPQGDAHAPLSDDAGQHSVQPDRPDQ